MPRADYLRRQPVAANTRTLAGPTHQAFVIGVLWADAHQGGRVGLRTRSVPPRRSAHGPSRTPRRWHTARRGSRPRQRACLRRSAHRRRRRPEQEPRGQTSAGGGLWLVSGGQAVAWQPDARCGPRPSVVPVRVRRPASPQIRVNIKGGMPTSASGTSRITGALAIAARTLDARTQARVPPTARRVPARREAGVPPGL